MKKQYITPVTELMEIESPQMMLTISSEQDETGLGNGSVGNNTPDLSNGRRGSWGDLWD